MTYVLLLMCPPQTTLTIDHVCSIENLLPPCDIKKWILEGQVYECHFQLTHSSHDDLRARSKTIRDHLKGAQIDIALLPAENRRKKLFVADMDSTMIEQECLDELADEVGIGEQIAAITARAMRGEIEFEPALKERVALLKGTPLSTLQHVLEKRIRFMKGAQTLLATMKAHNTRCCLVSGGFTEFTQAVGKSLGFDHNFGNRFEIEGGKLTGRVIPPILGRDAKRETLINQREQLKLTPQDTIAIGDGANDLSMIQEAGLGVALHAKPALRDAADIVIDHGDLTTLLYIQGYTPKEFVDTYSV